MLYTYKHINNNIRFVLVIQRNHTVYETYNIHNYPKTEIQCPINGYPDVEYYWVRDGKYLEDGDKFTFPPNPPLSNSSLGNYSCIGSNRAGKETVLMFGIISGGEERVVTNDNEIKITILAI